MVGSKQFVAIQAKKKVFFFGSDAIFKSLKSVFKKVEFGTVFYFYFSRRKLVFCCLILLHNYSPLHSILLVSVLSDSTGYGVQV